MRGEPQVPIDWANTPTGFVTAQRLKYLVGLGALVKLFDDSEKSPTDRESLLRDAISDQGASIQLRLGDEYYVTDMDVPKYLSASEDSLQIPGGQFALLKTHERVEVPRDYMALISLRSGTKLKGLVNVSGFHVDPNYEGPIQYGVFNAGPTTIVLRRRDTLFLVFFYRLAESAEKEYCYGGKPKERLDGGLISALKGRPVSLASLDKDVDSLKLQVRIFIGPFGTLFAAVVALIVKVVADS